MSFRSSKHRLPRRRRVVLATTTLMAPLLAVSAITAVNMNSGEAGADSVSSEAPRLQAAPGDLPIVPGLGLEGLGVPVPIPRKLPSLGGTEAPAPEAGASLASTTFVDDRTLDLKIASKAMDDQVDVRVLLPKDWNSDPNRTFPVLYMLPGYGFDDNHLDWTKWSDIKEFTADKNVLIVMPNAGRAGFCANWWNYGEGGSPAWETFHTDELIDVIENQFRTNGKRGVVGLSMGGYGAMAYAAKHPDLYNVAASYSGYLHTTLPGADRFAQITLQDKGLDPYALWGDPILQQSIWKANDPYELAENLQGSKTKLYVSAAMGARGEHDVSLPTKLINDLFSGDPVGGNRSTVLATTLETVAYVSSQSFVSKLNDLDIPVTTDFHATGTHSWGYWEEELHKTWNMLAQAIGATDSMARGSSVDSSSSSSSSSDDGESGALDGLGGDSGGLAGLGLLDGLLLGSATG